MENLTTVKGDQCLPIMTPNQVRNISYMDNNTVLNVDWAAEIKCTYIQLGGCGRGHESVIQTIMKKINICLTTFIDCRLNKLTTF